MEVDPATSGRQHPAQGVAAACWVRVTANFGRRAYAGRSSAWAGQHGGQRPAGTSLGISFPTLAAPGPSAPIGPRFTPAHRGAWIHPTLDNPAFRVDAPGLDRWSAFPCDPPWPAAPRGCRDSRGFHDQRRLCGHHCCSQAAVLHGSARSVVSRSNGAHWSGHSPANRDNRRDSADPRRRSV